MEKYKHSKTTGSGFSSNYNSSLNKAHFIKQNEVDDMAIASHQRRSRKMREEIDRNNEIYLESSDTQQLNSMILMLWFSWAKISAEYVFWISNRRVCKSS